MSLPQLLPGSFVATSYGAVGTVVQLLSDGQCVIALGSHIERFDSHRLKKYEQSAPDVDTLQSVLKWLWAPVTSGTVLDDVVRAGLLAPTALPTSTGDDAWAMRAGKRMQSHNLGSGYADAGPSMSEEDARKIWLGE